ncbi:MAG TPA: DNA methyltransferase [Candidatus Sulfotelmatobacter sp.]|nr:DNA methyltransferase [Candidatus Sulfotelmatobacter sp.]
MNPLGAKLTFDDERQETALEHGFPILEISQVAEHESWRKEINRPLYHIHKWWATRLGSVFRAITLGALSPKDTRIWDSFYHHHHFTGKTVLDPFMGSGTILGESLKLRANVVGCDINPVSTFLVRQSLARVPETTLREAFAQLERTIAPAIRRYYQTKDPSTGELIPVLYFFWVKMVRTPEGETIPLFGSYVFAQDAYPTKKPKAQIVCPECWSITEDRYDSTSLVCQACKHQFNPQQGRASGQHITSASGQKHRIKDLLPADGSPLPHRLYAIMALKASGEKIYLKPGPEDLTLYAEAETCLATESLPLPTLAVRPGHNTDQARGYNFHHWRDFFNARQLLCLGLLLREILRLEDRAVQEQMLCLFSSTLEFNNLFCSFKGEGTGAVRHMFSNHILKPERTPLENSVWGTDKSSGTFCSLFESRLIRAKRYLDEPFEVTLDADLLGNKAQARKIVASDPIDVHQVGSWDELRKTRLGALILSGDSSHLPIPDKSVDAVITDPPYFDFVHYSELSDFFFAWLSPVLRHRYAWFDRPDCSDSGEVQHKDPRTFARQLSYVLSECQRVLRDDGVLAFSFHHSRAEGWAAIYEAITTAGLEVVAAHPVHAEQRGASPKNAAKDPISLDAILVCRKHVQASAKAFDIETVLEKSASFAKTLVDAGMEVSGADRVVIASSQTLIASSAEQLPFEEIKARLELVRERLVNESLSYANAVPRNLLEIAG